jgi:hypothetical protein
VAGKKFELNELEAAAVPVGKESPVAADGAATEKAADGWLEGTAVEPKLKAAGPRLTPLPPSKLVLLLPNVKPAVVAELSVLGPLPNKFAEPEPVAAALEKENPVVAGAAVNEFESEEELGMAAGRAAACWLELSLVEDPPEGTAVVPKEKETEGAAAAGTRYGDSLLLPASLEEAVCVFGLKAMPKGTSEGFL